jgi:hypothetical protein
MTTLSFGPSTSVLAQTADIFQKLEDDGKSPCAFVIVTETSTIRRIQEFVQSNAVLSKSEASCLFSATEFHLRARSNTNGSFNQVTFATEAKFTLGEGIRVKLAKVTDARPIPACNLVTRTPEDWDTYNISQTVALLLPATDEGAVFFLTPETWGAMHVLLLHLARFLFSLSNCKCRAMLPSARKLCMAPIGQKTVLDHAGFHLSNHGQDTKDVKLPEDLLKWAKSIPDNPQPSQDSLRRSTIFPHVQGSRQCLLWFDPQADCAYEIYPDRTLRHNHSGWHPITFLKDPFRPRSVLVQGFILPNGSLAVRSNAESALVEVSSCMLVTNVWTQKDGSVDLEDIRSGVFASPLSPFAFPTEAPDQLPYHLLLPPSDRMENVEQFSHAFLHNIDNPRLHMEFHFKSRLSLYAPFHRGCCLETFDTLKGGHTSFPSVLDTPTENFDVHLRQVDGYQCIGTESQSFLPFYAECPVTRLALPTVNISVVPAFFPALEELSTLYESKEDDPDVKLMHAFLKNPTEGLRALDERIQKKGYGPLLRERANRFLPYAFHPTVHAELSHTEGKDEKCLLRNTGLGVCTLPVQNVESRPLEACLTQLMAPRTLEGCISHLQQRASAEELVQCRKELAEVRKHVSQDELRKCDEQFAKMRAAAEKPLREVSLLHLPPPAIPLTPLESLKEHSSRI